MSACLQSVGYCQTGSMRSTYVNVQRLFTFVYAHRETLLSERSTRVRKLQHAFQHLTENGNNLLHLVWRVIVLVLWQLTAKHANLTQMSLKNDTWCGYILYLKSLCICNLIHYIYWPMFYLCVQIIFLKLTVKIFSSKTSGVTQSAQYL